MTELMAELIMIGFIAIIGYLVIKDMIVTDRRNKEIFEDYKRLKAKEQKMSNNFMPPDNYDWRNWYK